MSVNQVNSTPPSRIAEAYQSIGVPAQQPAVIQAPQDKAFLSKIYEAVPASRKSNLPQLVKGGLVIAALGAAAAGGLALTGALVGAAATAAAPIAGVAAAAFFLSKPGRNVMKSIGASLEHLVQKHESPVVTLNRAMESEWNKLQTIKLNAANLMAHRDDLSGKISQMQEDVSGMESLIKKTLQGGNEGKARLYVTQNLGQKEILSTYEKAAQEVEAHLKEAVEAAKTAQQNYELLQVKQAQLLAKNELTPILRSMANQMAGSPPGSGVSMEEAEKKIVHNLNQAKGELQVNKEVAPVNVKQELRSARIQDKVDSELQRYKEELVKGN